jgi:hypothetical protein
VLNHFTAVLDNFYSINHFFIKQILIVKTFKHFLNDQILLIEHCFKKQILLIKHFFFNRIPSLEAAFTPALATFTQVLAYFLPSPYQSFPPTLKFIHTMGPLFASTREAQVSNASSKDKCKVKSAGPSWGC